MTDHLSAAAIIDEAHASSGLSNFDSDSYREGLDVLVGDVNAGIAKGWFIEAGVKRIQHEAMHCLHTRLKVADYLTRHPELLDRQIDRPVFVMGVPRTGTTLMSSLLAADPARRSPLTWEIDDPVPPATTATLRTDPRALIRLDHEMVAMAADPGMGKYYRGSAIYPNEDAFIMAGDFKTLLIEANGRLPAYKDFMFSCDMTSSYEYHKKFLAVLQSEAPGVWNCKDPSHALYLEYLFKIYPDARVIWTHRDPFTATGSLCSIISLSHMAHMGRIDTAWLSENYSWQAAEHANRIMDFRDKFGEDKIIDVHYADLIADPIGTMKKLYAQLDDAFTPDAAAGIAGWLDENPQGQFCTRQYRLEQYGLSLQQLEPLFERYLSRYDVAREG